MKQKDGARKNGLKAFRTVKKVLTAIGWEPEETDTEGLLRIDFTTDKSPVLEALADVRIEYERFLYYITFRDITPTKYRSQMMEFLTRANYDMVSGNFEFNLDNGSTRFKNCIDFTSSELTERLVRNVITCAMDAVELYADAFVNVARGRKTPKLALKEAEGG